METLSRDQQILAMKQKIEDKKSTLVTTVKYKTKCSITLRGFNYNLHVISLSQLQVLKIDIEELLKHMSHYDSINLLEFLEDINMRINWSNNSIIKKELEEMEKDLNTLLSQSYREQEKFNSVFNKLEDILK